MYRLFLFWFFSLGCDLLAQAPDLISGKIYRDSYLWMRGRTAGERTIVFGPDGQFVFLKHAWIQNPFVASWPGGGRMPLYPTEGDGQYSYRRIGISSATLSLRFDNGSTETMELVFTTPESGSYNDQAVREGVFQLKDAEGIKGAPAVNMSMRGKVGPGMPLMVGFVVPGTAGPLTGGRLNDPSATERDILIRVVGPSLAQFGVEGVWNDPRFQLFRGRTEAHVLQLIYDDWSVVPEGTAPSVSPAATERAFEKFFQFTGAFPLIHAAKDAAAIVRLSPGTYTILASVANDEPGGEALVEIYFLP